MERSNLAQLKDNPLPVLFDLSYNLEELYPSCYPINISSITQRYNARHADPPRYRYGSVNLAKYKTGESSNFMYIYCSILRKDIATIEELEKLYTWMSTIVMNGLLEDTHTTMELWNSVISLKYRKPFINFTPSIRNADQSFFFEYLMEIGWDIRKKTLKQFIVIPY